MLSFNKFNILIFNMQIIALVCLVVHIATAAGNTGATCADTDPPCTDVINPCLNGGKCCLQSEKPVCDCQGTEGYAGGFCHERPCVPTSQPCLNGGTCENSKGKYYCRCLPEFTGPKCEVAPCAKSPCQNGGTCRASGGSYFCRCPTDAAGKSIYGGRDCELTPCSPNPCQNGGTCSVRGRSGTGIYYRCQCTANFYGQSCEETNPCAKNPCQNEATCQATTSYDWGYWCNPQNATEWFGVNAELPSPCVTGNFTCENGGTCERSGWSDYPDRYHCKCSDDWVCANCDSPNACKKGLIEFNEDGTSTVIKSPSELCHNGGTCFPYCRVGANQNGYGCRCPMGYTGKDCTVRYAKRAHCCGDPRCFSFDGNVFNYHGTCHTVLTKTCDDENWPANIPTFQIIGNFRRCSTEGLTCTNGVSLEIDGQMVEILIDNKAYVNNEEAVLPYHLANPEDPNGEPLLTIQVDPHDPLTTLAIQTSSGLYVTQNRRCLEVHLSHELYTNVTGKVCGLFGNADNDESNDMAGLENEQDFFASTILRPETPEGCSISELDLSKDKRRKKRLASDSGTPSACANESHAKQALQACSIINHKTGPFGACNRRMNAGKLDKMVENCMEDYCVDAAFKCDNLEGFAKVCGSMSQYSDWRSIAGCPIMCPEGMTYSLQAHRYCTKTCFHSDPCPEAQTNIIHNVTNDEGCKCNGNTVWDVKSGTCVELAQCGKTEWTLPPHFGDSCRPADGTSNSSLPVCSTDSSTQSQRDGHVVVAWSNLTAPYSNNIYAYNVVTGVWTALPDRAATPLRDTFLTTSRDNIYLVSGFTGRKLVKTDKDAVFSSIAKQSAPRELRKGFGTGVLTALPDRAATPLRDTRDNIGRKGTGRKRVKTDKDAVLQSISSQSAPLELEKGFGITVASSNNRTYLIGGEKDLKGAVSIGCDGVWRTLANTANPHYYSSAAVLDGAVYVCGTLRSEASQLCEVYQPVSDKWEDVPPMNIARKGMAAVSMKGSLYIVGGAASQNERYDPATRQWSFFRALPRPSYLAAVTTDGENIFVIGGSNENGLKDYNDLNIYLPNMDIWITKEIVFPIGKVPSATFAIELPTDIKKIDCNYVRQNQDNTDNTQQSPQCRKRNKASVPFYISYTQSPEIENVSQTMSLSGRGSIDNCTGLGKFIIYGHNTFHSDSDQAISHSVCIEGTMDMKDHTWEAKGRSGNKSFTGSGTFKAQSIDAQHGGMVELVAEKLLWSIISNPPLHETICGEVHKSDETNVTNTDYIYSWVVESHSDASLQTHWSGHGNKDEQWEMHTIHGYVGSGEQQSGCLTYVNRNETSNSFNATGHINGRKLSVNGTIHSGMFLVDKVTLETRSGLFGTYTKPEQGVIGSFMTGMESQNGRIYSENKTWSNQEQVGMIGSSKNVSGTYANGTFRGSGTLYHMPVEVTGKYGAACYFTDPIDKIACPTNSPHQIREHEPLMYGQDSFYMCGSFLKGTDGAGSVEGSGWLYKSEDPNDYMMHNLTAEPITLIGTIKNHQVAISPDYNHNSFSSNITFTVKDSSEKPIVTYDDEIFLALHNNFVTGELVSQAFTINIYEGHIIGNMFAVTGTLVEEIYE